MRCWDGVKGGKYYLVDTMEKFSEFLEKARKQAALAVDTETDGLDWVTARACGIVIGWGVENNYYIPINHKDFDTGILEIKLITPSARYEYILLFKTTGFTFSSLNSHYKSSVNLKVSFSTFDNILLALKLENMLSLFEISTSLIASSL